MEGQAGKQIIDRRVTRRVVGRTKTEADVTAPTGHRRLFILFICSLFSDAVTENFIEPNDWLTVSNQLERMGREAVVA
jgi:hypothetical protein